MSGPDLTPVMAGARIGRATATWVVVCFVVMMVAPAVQETLSDSTTTLLSSLRKDVTKYGVQVALQEVEKHFVYDSQFANAVRRPYQRFLITRLRQGSRTVLVGGNGMLFHRSDAASVSGPGILSEAFVTAPEIGTAVVEEFFNTTFRHWRGRAPVLEVAEANEPFADSVSVLSDFSTKLRQRGVHLVVVVVPGKSTVYPELLWQDYPLSDGPALNSDYVAWRERVAGQGVDVVDLSESFWQAKNDHDEPLFLRQDTHWSPRGVALGAQIVAERLEAALGKHDATAHSASILQIPEPTDLLALMGLRADLARTQRTIEVTRITADATGATNVAPVLIFGDSLTGYYDVQRAGLADQLALRLGTNVDRYIGYGADLPRAIRNAFVSQPGLLAGRRVVVLELYMGQIYSRTFTSRLYVP